MLKSHPILRLFLWLILLASSGAFLVFTGIILYLGPKLPPVEKILEIQLQTPLRIYSSEGKLIAEFGEKKRTPMAYADIPPTFVHAILAAEDSRFFEHPGVDIKGLSRAALELVSTGSIQSGGSTITMQVAKNYFLTSERTFLRKFNEILLSLEMERQLSKEKILELYVNKIYLGHRAYGLQAAAQVYYGKPVADLTLAQLAMIAGLPKAPSAFNPITNPARALERRNWILSRMRELGYIDQASFASARSEPNTAELFGIPVEVEAPYFAEMVRQEMVNRFGEAADEDGYKVFTTLKADNQVAANGALQDGLIAYDKRHGYRGAEASLRVDADGNLPEDWQEKLRAYRTIGPLQPAIVSAIQADGATAILRTGEQISIPFKAMEWARPFIDNSNRGAAPQKPADVVKPGDIIRVQRDNDQWQLSQIPAAQAAMVSLDSHTGAIIALVGGFDFQASKFNRVIQAGRQAGSSFKPFVYSAAIDKGMTPATLINDAPIVLEDTSLEDTWRPENAEGKFLGPMRLRQALYKSRNLVSIRILREIGVPFVLDYVSKFGFDPTKLPRNLSLALGSAVFTPLEIATGYAAFANGGYKVEPWFIQRIEDADGNVLFEADPLVACDEACRASLASASDTTDTDENADADSALLGESQPLAAADEPTPAPRFAEQILDPRTQFLVVNMMQDVIRRGTATKARTLNRPDLAGKTGTTNDQKDAWFSGFNKDVVATAWVGFDQPQNLGRGEYGGTAALPIWIDYMRVALKDSPVATPRIPDGIVTVRIDPDTGKRATPDQPDGIFEYFRVENAPPVEIANDQRDPLQIEGAEPEQLF
jgi:penicillin-binding protein 1A